ncbi:ATP-binding protein [Actinoplanes solisilvae]|uniref:ATP-binding protein n=1 Tax=Actinoplanes solisilvae TaxID=2486853 RepID=UPI000FDC38C5|nr:ATP-binding protein [Actinoplanes solisilvae]
MTSPGLGIDELRTLFLFEKLDDGQLAWLRRAGTVQDRPAGWVYREGDPAESFFVLLAGTVALTSRVGPDDVEFTRSSRRGVFGGAFQAYLGERLPRYSNSMRAETPARFFVLSAEDFAWLMREWFPMSVHLLEGLFYGSLGTRQAIGQREHLLALGSLAAGLAHELNNPAAAVARAASSLRERIDALDANAAEIAAGPHASEELSAFSRLRVAATAAATAEPPSGALETAEREDRMAEWLEDQGVPGGWELAPTFVQARLDDEWFAGVWPPGRPGDSRERVLRRLGLSIELDTLSAEIAEASARISSLVDAVRQYTQLDRASSQIVDVHDGLDSTLVVLASTLGAGVRVVKEYDRGLPPIPAFAAELNQVWTCLLDNAADAMNGTGTLFVRTRRDDAFLLIEIEDTGTGIADDILPRVFDPFFTTKPVGRGVGLGLTTAWRIVTVRHHGDVRVDSIAGRTTFRVRLPFAG